MSQSVDPSRNLLFGLLALQVGLIDQARLVAAFQAWTLDKSRPVADYLIALGHLDAADRAAVEVLVTHHLKKNGSSALQSLAAIPAGRSTRERLAGMGDPEVEATLGYVGTEPGPAQDGEADSDRTDAYGVGTATSLGQRFRILRPHARGGLGAVFVALDTELHREVALKQIVDSHADDPVSRTRFLLEAEITGGLEHPGIVPVYGLGTDGDGRPYYAMRFIRGGSLKAGIQQFHADFELNRNPGRHSLELRKLLRRFTDVCNAIEYAHSRGVLHRDIKPGNVIVGRYGETLVVDWGLAKAIGRAQPVSDSGERTLKPSSASGSAETLAGLALGTPAYMSPEQAEGDLARLGPRSDVYSLGATLYCLLSGQPPFAGDVADVIGAVQRGEVRPPRQLNPSIDRALEAICTKAMAHKPADRYATPRALADDVEKWMADEPVSAWREPFSVQARRWARRHRTAVTASAAAVLVALAGTAAVLAVQTRAKHALAVSNSQLRRANTRESAARVRAQARFDLAKKAIEAYYTGASEDVLLKQPELEGLRDRLLRTALDFYRELVADLDADREAGLDPKARGELARAGFRVALITEEIGKLPDALAAFRQTLAVRREMTQLDPSDAESRLDVANCLSHIGLLLVQTGLPADSMRHYIESRAILEHLRAERPGDLLACDHLAWNLSNTGLLEMRTGHHDEARRSLQKALEIRRRLAEGRPDNLECQTNLANALHSLGVLAESVGHSEEAMGLYRRTAELEKGLADAHPELSRLQDSLASIYNDMANVVRYQRDGEPEGMRLYRESLAIRESLVRGHPTVSRYQEKLAAGHYNLGLVLANEGRWGDATESFRRAQTLEQALERANPSVTDYRKSLAKTQASLAYVSQRLGRRRESAAAYREALGVWERLARAEPSNPMYREELARCLEDFADLLEAEGRADEALASHRQALAVRLRLVQDHPKVAPYLDQLATSQFWLAEFLAATGRSDEARRAQREGLAVREELVRAEPNVDAYKSLLADGYGEVARLEVDAGRSGEALSRLEAAGSIYDRLAAAKPRDFLDRENQPEFQLVLGTALEASGDLARAMRAYERSRVVTEKMPVLYSLDHFHLACVYARLSALAMRLGPSSGLGGAGDPEARAAKAIDELRRALAAHYAFPLRLRTEPNLHPLRPRPDFRLLLMDLAFPSEPFAR